MIKRLKEHIEMTSPKLSIGASLGISMVTQMFLRTARIINMVGGEKSYTFYIADCLTTIEGLLAKVPPLALKDSREFSQDVCKSLHGLYDFILNLIETSPATLEEAKAGGAGIGGPMTPRELQVLAVKTMFRAALATGYPVREFLKYLNEYTPGNSGEAGVRKFANRQVSIVSNSGKYISAERNGKVGLSQTSSESTVFEVAVMGKYVALKSLARSGGASWLTFDKGNDIKLSESCGKEQKLVISPYADDEDEGSYFILKTLRGTALWASDSELKQMAMNGLDLSGPVVFKISIKEDDIPDWADDEYDQSENLITLS
eukprot:jgi/Bigna1/140613/aug1.57_g15321